MYLLYSVNMRTDKTYFNLLDTTYYYTVLIENNINVLSLKYHVLMEIYFQYFLLGGTAAAATTKHSLLQSRENYFPVERNEVLILWQVNVSFCN